MSHPNFHRADEAIKWLVRERGGRSGERVWEGVIRYTRTRPDYASMPDVDLDALDALERSLAKTPPHAGTAAQLKFEHFTRKHHESLLGAINAYVANLNEQRVGHPLD